MDSEPRTIAATYFDSWKAKDFATLRSILADDVDFVGSMAKADTAEACVQGMKGLAEMFTDLVTRKVFVDGPDVLTWYDMHTASGPPMPIANWCHVEGGKITRIRVTFDPRPMLP